MYVHVRRFVLVRACVEFCLPLCALVLVVGVQLLVHTHLYLFLCVHVRMCALVHVCACACGLSVNEIIHQLIGVQQQYVFCVS